MPPGPEPGPEPQPPDVNPPEPPTKEPPAIDEEEDNVVLPPVDPNAPITLPEEVQLVDPTAEELTSLYQIGFSAANMQRFNLGDRMFQIQQSVVPTPEPVPPPISPGKEIEGKGVEGKAPPPAPPPSPINRWGVWANSWGDFVNLDSTNAAQGYRFTTFGISAGVDYLIIPNHFAVGLFGGYSHSWINFTPSGSATANTGRGGLYATYFNQGWWVDVAGWGGGTNYSTSRQALAGTANGETSGWEVSTHGEAGYDFHWNDLPFGDLTERYGLEAELRRLGERSPEEISQFLSSVDFGIATTPLSLIGKSASVAAMLDHGLPVIVNRNDVHFRGITDIGPSSERLIPVDEMFLERLTTVRRQPPKARLPEVAAQFFNDIGTS